MINVTILVDWEKDYRAPKHITITMPKQFYTEGVGKFIHGWLYGRYGMTPLAFSIEGVSE